MFLSQHDIEELTGYKVYKCQIKWLRQNGLKFLVSADGKPRVLMSQLEARIGAIDASKSARRRVEPDEAGLERWMRR